MAVGDFMHTHVHAENKDLFGKALSTKLPNEPLQFPQTFSAPSRIHAINLYYTSKAERCEVLPKLSCPDGEHQVLNLQVDCIVI